MTTPRIRYNIIANYAGAGWNALMSFIFVPWYIKYLGIEAYGIIGFFASIQAVLYLLDMGLGLTFSKEVAALSVKPDSAKTLRDLTRTFATVYWGIALVAGALFAALAPVFAHFWLKADTLNADTIAVATLLMGLVLIIRWPGNIYSGGLMGLQRQVDVNVVNVISATLRGAGAVAVLHFISPTLQAFFIWQFIVNVLNTGMLYIVLQKRLPVSALRAKFDFGLLKARWRFAAGMTGITLVALMLTQLDKLLLSKMVSLKEFGYYTLGSTLAGVITLAIGPIISAFFPRFTALVSADNKRDLSASFHSACQLIAFFMVPAAVVIAVFSKEVLLLWTRNADIAEHAHLVLTIVITGSMFNGFMNIPYQVQLAHGWTSLAFRYNLAALVFLVPGIVFLTKQYGIVGGAAAWAILNASYVLIAIRFMFRKILKGEMLRWYIWSVGVPLAIAVGAALGIKYCLGSSTEVVGILLRLVLAIICVYGLLIYALPVSRNTAKGFLQFRRV